MLITIICLIVAVIILWFKILQIDSDLKRAIFSIESNNEYRKMSEERIDDRVSCVIHKHNTLEKHLGLEFKELPSKAIYIKENKQNER